MTVVLGLGFFIRPNVVFVGLMMDSEARSFIEPLQVAPGFKRGKGVKTPGDSSIIGHQPIQ